MNCTGRGVNFISFKPSKYYMIPNSAERYIGRPTREQLSPGVDGVALHGRGSARKLSLEFRGPRCDQGFLSPGDWSRLATDEIFGRHLVLSASSPLWPKR